MDEMIKELYGNNHTLEDIAKQCGISRFILKKKLTDLGVEIRNRSETISCKNQFILTSYIKDVIVGELLGDGSIYKSGTTSGGFVNSTSRKKYLEWLYLDIFKRAGIETMKEGITTTTSNPRDNFTIKQDTISYRARTLSYLQFGEFRKKWYPNDNKIVPDDVIITPTVLMHWYLGDGSIHRKIGHNKLRGKTSYIYKNVYLHTNGFKIKECELLADKLISIGFEFKVVRHNSNGVINYQLKLMKPAENNEKFFSYMGDCPIELTDIYGYKWDWNTEIIDRK